MKKVILSILVLCVAVVFGGYAQTPTFDGTREEAVEIVRNSEFIRIVRFHYDEDLRSTTIDRFISEVNKIVPVNPKTSKQLKTDLLSADRTIVLWPVGGSPLIIPEMFEILEKTFGATEYEMLSKVLLENLTETASAYLYLSEIYKKETGWVVGTPVDLPHYIDRVFEHFNISI